MKITTTTPGKGAVAKTGDKVRVHYTGTFEDRFFFEIVQRRDYKGFGAVNAGVRMTAQASRRGKAGPFSQS